MAARTVDAAAPHRTPHNPVGRVVGLAVGLAALVAIVVLAFSWPAVTAEPKDVPVALVGPEAAVSALQSGLEEQTGDLLDFTVLDDRDAAVDAIEQRDVVGAIVVGQEPELLTATASGSVGAVVKGLATPLQAALTAQSQAAAAAAGVEATAVTLTVTDVVPYADSDPNGLGFSAASFPILLGGMLGGILLSIAVVGSMRRVTGLVVYAAVGGIVLTSIMQSWLGVIQGDYWLNAAAFGLSLAAIGAPIIGAVALLGRAGIAVGPVVMMLFANPISGAGVPASYLPGGWGAVGQWFPPGASATLLRDLSYFPEADTTFPWLVLGAWALGGVLLAVIGKFRTAGGAEPDREAALEDAPESPAGEREPALTA
ncbi:hypothetical protein [Agromyces seonyuensis]|uniref:ABC transporter permease n=1 Tax=Agromyces seonyuensis TaxID=2662446 RepID=A0A6I4NZY3_9MICO|nr:hypothetical protein [Agromyces seonyuensis]MWB98782.1 hypothetical protein [Agromyces seonyuensis]